MNNIRNTNLRFNLNKEIQKKAWDYLQTMDRTHFKSYSQVISFALVDYFERYYHSQDDPYLETREREELFVNQIIASVEHAMEKSLPVFLAGCMTGAMQRVPQNEAPSAPSLEANDADVDWDFLGD
jgi:hypothetical protein